MYVRLFISLYYLFESVFCYIPASWHICFALFLIRRHVFFRPHVVVTVYNRKHPDLYDPPAQHYKANSKNVIS